MTAPAKCRTCQLRVPAAGDRCAHCWRDRSIYLETLLIRTQDQIRELGRHLQEDTEALIQEARQACP